MAELSPEQAQEIVKDSIEREVKKCLRVLLYKIEMQLIDKQRQGTYRNHPESVVSVSDIKHIFSEYNIE